MIVLAKYTNNSKLSITLCPSLHLISPLASFTATTFAACRSYHCRRHNSASDYPLLSRHTLPAAVSIFVRIIPCLISPCMPSASFTATAYAACIVAASSNVTLATSQTSTEPSSCVCHGCLPWLPLALSTIDATGN